MGNSHEKSNIIALLKACSKEKNLCKGSKIHADIMGNAMLENDVHVGSVLVNMYAKCGAIKKAQEVFNALPTRDVVSWTSLIGGYATHGLEKEALSGFELMKGEGVSPDSITFVYVLKACGNLGLVDKGQELQAEIARQGWFRKNTLVGNVLIEMYAKCAAISKACEVFNELLARGVDTWNVLLGGYIQHDYGEEALCCFERMQHDGLIPDVGTYVFVLKGCGSLLSLDKGRQIHARIASEGLIERHSSVGNVLIDMYAKCGAPEEAQKVFHELPVHDLISWTTLITGYMQHGCGQEALNCYEQLLQEGLFLDAVALACIFKACGFMVAIGKGQEIHARIVGDGWVEKHVLVGNALLDMYGKCGAVTKANEVFNKLGMKDTVSWNAILAGYAQIGDGQKALESFRQMQCEGFSSDTITCVCILKACGSNIDLDEKALEIHAGIVGGRLEENMLVNNVLIDTYAKHGAFDKAKYIFDKLSVHDVVTWNALISGYVQYGHHEEALGCFELMQCKGTPAPDVVTYICVLKSCSSLRACHKGQEIHADISKEQSIEKDLFVGNALMDMYFKCGLIMKAQEVFDQIIVRDVVTWNVLISGYAQLGYNEEAMSFFEVMKQRRDVSPNEVTYVCVLKACSNLGDAEKGQEIHGLMIREGWMAKDSQIGNVLVDMYARCGALRKAQEVFNELLVKTIVTWNFLIGGYAQLGDDKMVFTSFNKMIEGDINPDQVTFLSLLTTCIHSGQLELGIDCFIIMYSIYGIIPTIEHVICMIDLYGRAGHFEKVVSVIIEMPFLANLALWQIVLGACQKWGNSKLGKMAFEFAVELDERDVASYILMSNIYAIDIHVT